MDDFLGSIHKLLRKRGHIYIKLWKRFPMKIRYTSLMSYACLLFVLGNIPVKGNYSDCLSNCQAQCKETDGLFKDLQTIFPKMLDNPLGYASAFKQVVGVIDKNVTSIVQSMQTSACLQTPRCKAFTTAFNNDTLTIYELACNKTNGCQTICSFLLK